MDTYYRLDATATPPLTGPLTAEQICGAAPAPIPKEAYPPLPTPTDERFAGLPELVAAESHAEGVLATLFDVADGRFYLGRHLHDAHVLYPDAPGPDLMSYAHRTLVVWLAERLLLGLKYSRVVRSEGSIQVLKNTTNPGPFILKLLRDAEKLEPWEPR